jgi:hypothetical protein
VDGAHLIAGDRVLRELGAPPPQRSGSVVVIYHGLQQSSMARPMRGRKFA